MHKEDEHVRCPYYRKDGVQSVHCEGVQPGSGLHLGFASQQQYKDYKNARCRGQWHGCLIAGMLNQKYDYRP